MKVYVGLNKAERVVYRLIESYPDSPIDMKTLYEKGFQHWSLLLYDNTLNSLLKKGVLVKKEPEWRMGIAEEHGHQSLVITKDGVPQRRFDLDEEGALKLVYNSSLE